MGRPAKSLEQHVREGSFRARRHADFLAGPDLERWPACAALQAQYRETEDAGARSAIALEFERAVARAHREVSLASDGSSGHRSMRASTSAQRAQVESSAEDLSRRVSRLALSPNEAAEALGVSRDFFDEHIAPELRIVRRGRRKLIAIRELERWLEREAALTLRRTA